MAPIYCIGCPSPCADEVVKEVYSGDKDEPREGVVAIQGGGLPLDTGALQAAHPPVSNPCNP